jgi:hypothetical protein
MARCNNGADGLDGRIHYSDELAALRAEKERIMRSKAMT